MRLATPSGSLRHGYHTLNTFVLGKNKKQMLTKENKITVQSPVKDLFQFSTK